MQRHNAHSSFQLCPQTPQFGTLYVTRSYSFSLSKCADRQAAACAAWTVFSLVCSNHSQEAPDRYPAGTQSEALPHKLPGRRNTASECFTARLLDFWRQLKLLLLYDRSRWRNAERQRVEPAVSCQLRVFLHFLLKACRPATSLVATREQCFCQVMVVVVVETVVHVVVSVKYESPNLHDMNRKTQMPGRRVKKNILCAMSVVLE